MENLVINIGNPRRVELTVLSANGVKVELSRCTDVQLILWINGRSKRALTTQISNDVLISDLSASELSYLGEYSGQVKYTDNGVQQTTERVYLFRVANEFFKSTSGTGVSDTGSLVVSVSTPVIAYDQKLVSDAEKATADANAAKDSANTAAINANDKANLANTAANNADVAKTNAEKATADANTATLSAINAATNANAKAVYANEQGDYAKQQGLNAVAITGEAATNANNAAFAASQQAAYAKQQGDYAKQEAQWIDAKIATKAEQSDLVQLEQKTNEKIEAVSTIVKGATYVQKYVSSLAVYGNGYWNPDGSYTELGGGNRAGVVSDFASSKEVLIRNGVDNATFSFVKINGAYSLIKPYLIGTRTVNEADYGNVLYDVYQFPDASTELKLYWNTSKVNAATLRYYILNTEQGGLVKDVADLKAIVESGAIITSESNVPQALFAENCYYRKTTNVKVSNQPLWLSTNFISTKNIVKLKYKLYQIKDVIDMISFYDKEKKYIGGCSLAYQGASDGLVESIVDIPANTAYYIATLHNVADELPQQYLTEILEYDVAVMQRDVNSLVSARDNKYKYSHCLNKPFDLQGKSAVFFGDSVVFGTMSTDASTMTYCDQNWVQRLCAKFSMSKDVQAVNGSEYVDTVNSYSILNKVLNYNTQKDFFFIGGAINDWFFGKTLLGAMGDTTGNTFYGALYLICEKFKNAFPNSTVIFLTIINQSSQKATPRYSINAYRNAMFEMATKYGFNVIDGSQIGFPTENGAYKDIMIPDGVHPSELGHEFMFKSICGILK